MTVGGLIQLLTRSHLLKRYNQTIVFQDCDGNIHDINDEVDTDFLSVSSRHSRHGDSEVIIRLKCTVT